MDRHILYKQRKNQIKTYVRVHWKLFDFSILKPIMYKYRSGSSDKQSYNDCIMMIDTETSKHRHTGKDEHEYNYVCAWTLSIRAFDTNICTIFGNKPVELVYVMSKIHDVLPGDKSVYYVHNLPYDWVFLRKFMFDRWQTPRKQLNTKPNRQIYIEFENGVILKDSLILSQRSLNKWSQDMDVEHKKAVGKWDYDKIRTQKEVFSDDELTYIENDTLAGVECLQKTMDMLHKHIYSVPMTATGIPREEVRKRGKQHNARGLFKRICPTYDQYIKLTHVYHGGYTHADMHKVGYVWEGVTAYDFASSYPYAMLCGKFPMEKFTPFRDLSVSELLSMKDDYAFMFKFCAKNIRLKDSSSPMPPLQMSKTIHTLNEVLDNGRVLCADYVDIYLTELDLDVINRYYDYEWAICKDVEFASKNYLPRWFIDYVFELFRDKTMEKGGDPVLYALLKAKLNSLYGMLVQRSIRDNYIENYETGEFSIEESDAQELYEKYINNRNSILPYQWGVWVTAIAFHNLFTLGECAGEWLYSDTDSCYGIDWDLDKLKAYNDQCKQNITDNGYGCVVFNNREYWLGVVELDGVYSEFKVLGAKRYCVRYADDTRNKEKDRNKLKITVAGVPKKGVECLGDDIDNFVDGVIFDGETSGKLQHTHLMEEGIMYDENGIEYADSIDLSPCDYLMQSVPMVDWESIFYDEFVESGYCFG